MSNIWTNTVLGWLHTSVWLSFIELLAIIMLWYLSTVVDCPEWRSVSFCWPLIQICWLCGQTMWVSLWSKSDEIPVVSTFINFFWIEYHGSARSPERDMRSAAVVCLDKCSSLWRQQSQHDQVGARALEHHQTIMTTAGLGGSVPHFSNPILIQQKLLSIIDLP